MSSKSRTFTFNTALYAINGVDLDEAALRDLVRPIRAKLMAFDGFTGCNITRYKFTVHFLSEVISEEEVIATVWAVTEWAAALHDNGLNDKFFPLRGSKKPKATPDWSDPEPHVKSTAWVKVDLNCNIVPLPVALKREERQALLVELCKDLLEKLVNHGAVVLYGLGIQRIELCYKTDQATEEEIRKHIQGILVAAVEEENSKFFTLLGDRPLQLTFV